MLAYVKSVTIAALLHPIQAVQLADARLGATLRSLCLILSLNLRGQQQRIQRDPALRRALVTVTLPTRQGSRDTDVLLVWAIPIWLLGLKSSRLPKEKQALITVLQEKAVQAIYEAFWSAAQQNILSDEQYMLPEEVPEDERIDSQFADRFQALEARQDTLEARQDALERRMEREEARLDALEAQTVQLVSQLRWEARLRVNDERLLAATIARMMQARPLPAQHPARRGRPTRKRR